ncbi:6-phosphogluconate dehydrogenase [Siccirubricoccus deserti]|uniref:NAD(P)-dependent oxidoreductase n=1 Tax=Siccirubricoccus deserti TaxID=2013562 RepID=A0A9X0UCD1_9PROT|nr:NAD(P)-dependent oxidoreductase [Siccirubricoccus deserti]MBC4015102.1 NAD(P)-dependent oxidoreductase [Siccirubricoccus deserti]GGC38914.1 6-phosphogluconate dehydrogenase [Siccirubricoccus deserti]
MPTIAILAQGAMGAGIGRRLAQRGCTVLTSLAGRSEASARRAAEAGMRDATPAELAGADIFLSVLPPAEAQATAEWLAPALAAAPRKAVYADCNAISPRTALLVAGIIAPTGAGFVDGGIIGGPPREDGYTPVLYVSGEEAGRLMPLNDHGLEVRLTPGGVGAASALKMSYAGITKGLVALASAMILAAGRNGAAEGLRAELERSQPQLLAWFGRMVPPMYDKAYRWVGEMEEIADFTGPEAAAIYQAIAGFYATMATDNAGPKEATAALSAFLRKG